MRKQEVATRRRFFGHAGAALALPLSATAALAERPAAGNDSAARLAALEDANAIRLLQSEYARLVNAGAHAEAAKLFAEPAAAPVDATLRRLAADRFAAHDVVDVAPDGATATARLECTVETETNFEDGYTLVDMLREQGDAVLHAVEVRVLEGEYVKHSGVWKISRLALNPV